jgi:hypothetical protein
MPPKDQKDPILSNFTKIEDTPELAFTGCGKTLVVEGYGLQPVRN